MRPQPNEEFPCVPASAKVPSCAVARRMHYSLANYTTTSCVKESAQHQMLRIHSTVPHGMSLEKLIGYGENFR